MDSSVLVNLLNEFDQLRIDRLAIAQEFLARYNDNAELFADLANLFALFYAAEKISQIPQGFKSDSGG